MPEVISYEEKVKGLKENNGINFCCMDEENGKEAVNFYYDCMKMGLSSLDSDEYATLNTLFGYDIGAENAKLISRELWETEDISVMELPVGQSSQEQIQAIADNLGLALDFSKWRMEEYLYYSYYTK